MSAAIISFAQKEDNVWLLGGSIGSPDTVFKSCSVDFSGGLATFQHINLDLPFIRTNASLCDSSGALMCYSNGENLYNREYQIMEGGKDFYPNAFYQQGFPAIQGFMLLPMPGRANQVAHIYGNIKTIFPPSGANLGYIRLLYGIADMTLNDGKGKVVSRDLVVGTDTLIVGQMTATRHGNGRDWWLLVPHYIEHRFYRYLLSPEGLDKVGEQNIPSCDFALGQTVFSPDGNWYARFAFHGTVPDSAFSTFEMFRFDRCTGHLSERVSKTYDYSGKGGKPGGVAFSPSSRYLYVSRWDTLYQYDLKAPDLLASEVAVAGYDGFLGDFNRPTRFYSLLLAPDNKIYCCVANNNSRYLHVIERPEEPGAACDFRQHAIQLPVFNNFLVPNMPYYRLWEWKGSPCDTLGVSSLEQPTSLSQIRISPNPSPGTFQIQLPDDTAEGFDLLVYDTAGKLRTQQRATGGTQPVQLPDHLPNGVYTLCVFRENGQLLGRARVAVMR